jgi:NADH-quinone oxidoreductase subunit N
MNLLLTPESLLLAWALLMILLECFTSKCNPRCFANIAMAGVLLVFCSILFIPQVSPVIFKDLYLVDSLSLFFKQFFLITIFFVLWMGKEYIDEIEHGKNEFFILPLFTTIGMMLLASAADFVTLFVSLELVTISFYILVGYQRNRIASLEAATKYLIIGGLSTGFLVYGLAFLFGLVGTTKFDQIFAHFLLIPSYPGLVFALTLIAIGVAFKIASFPFHIWAPDVYQGAPTPVTAFLSTGSKVAGFVILLRIFCLSVFSVGSFQNILHGLFEMFAYGSLIIGSFAALPQRNLKRLLGYSSISHAGFLLMGVSTLSERGIYAVLVYFCIYLLSTILAFFIICQLSSKLGGDDFRHYAGLSQRSPLLAFGLTLSFVSLAGIPPLAGFFGKLSIFGAVYEAANFPLLITGLICAVIGLYFYLGIVRSMYWNEPHENAVLHTSYSSKCLITLLCLATFVFGVWPTPLVKIVNDALSSFIH